MKQLITFFFAIFSAFAFGQTNHTVNALTMSWSPFDLSIDAGDSVTWINFNQGNHNINGTTATFPQNPESFGMLTVSGNWTYGHRFNIPGVYNYRCDPHSSTMLGKVTVIGPAQLSENDEQLLTFGPNPTTTTVLIKSQIACDHVAVYNLPGEIVLQQDLKESMELDVSKLQKGAYFLIISGEGYVFREQLIKE